MNVIWIFIVRFEELSKGVRSARGRNESSTADPEFSEIEWGSSNNEPKISAISNPINAITSFFSGSAPLSSNSIKSDFLVSQQFEDVSGTIELTTSLPENTSSSYEPSFTKFSIEQPTNVDPIEDIQAVLLLVDILGVKVRIFSSR
jgi:hypothetical protein